MVIRVHCCLLCVVVVSADWVHHVSIWISVSLRILRPLIHVSSEQWIVVWYVIHVTNLRLAAVMDLHPIRRLRILIVQLSVLIHRSISKITQSHSDLPVLWPKWLHLYHVMLFEIGNLFIQTFNFDFLYAFKVIILFCILFTLHLNLTIEADLFIDKSLNFKVLLANVIL